MLYLMFNPKAQGGKCFKALADVKSIYFNRQYTEINVLSLKSPSDFLAGLTADDEVCIIGGDGTLNHFVNDMPQNGFPFRVLLYSQGTGNDFLNDIAENHKEDIIDITPYLNGLPTVEVNGEKRKFINGIGYGVDGYCCEEGDRLREKGKKYINYSVIAFMGLMGKFKPRGATVTVDGEARYYKKTWLAPAMFGRFYGGKIMIAPDQQRNNKEGTLTSVAVHSVNKINVVFKFLSIYKGKHTKYKDIIDIRTGRQITVEFDEPCALQIDGETIHNVKKYAVYSAALADNALEEAKTAEYSY